ncbi:MAG: Rnf-Nqr domain containing protein, partial [Planctomycetota bacterium]
MEYFSIGFGSIFVYNLVLARFLGLCPFVGVSKKMSSAVGMGIAVTFVMTMAAIVTFLANMLLVHLELDK